MQKFVERKYLWKCALSWSPFYHSSILQPVFICHLISLVTLFFPKHRFQTEQWFVSLWIKHNIAD